MNNVALVIIYNHNYEKNIEPLEKIYKDRFDSIYHLMPFYRGEKDNVIEIYENSYYFHGYVNQFYSQLKRKDYDHYFFIADDLILNPKINQNNYNQILNLEVNKSFLPGFIYLNQKSFWTHIKKAIKWSSKMPGLEINKSLPEFNTAVDIFKKNGIDYLPINWRQLNTGKINIFDSKKPFLIFKRLIIYSVFRVIFFSKLIYLFSTFKLKKLYLKYPMVGSYSDIFIVDSKSIADFSHYCGIFAVTELFVEIAIPTSLVLTGAKISQESDLTLNGGAIWHSDELNNILNDYDYSLKNLLNNFPKDKLYLHPIKLSLMKD